MAEKAKDPRATGMVSEETLKKQSEEINGAIDPSKVPPVEVTMVFMAQMMHDNLEEMKKLVRYFEKAANTSVATSIPPPRPTSEKTEINAQTGPVPADRVQLILDTLSMYEDLDIDTESSAPYVKVKPKKYLGTEVFAEVANKIKKDLGGQYVSKGKESHWLIPKLK